MALAKQGGHPDVQHLAPGQLALATECSPCSAEARSPGLGQARQGLLARARRPERLQAAGHRTGAVLHREHQGDGTSAFQGQASHPGQDRIGLTLSGLAQHIQRRRGLQGLEDRGGGRTCSDRFLARFRAHRPRNRQTHRRQDGRLRPRLGEVVARVGNLPWRRSSWMLSSLRPELDLAELHEGRFEFLPDAPSSEQRGEGDEVPSTRARHRRPA